MVSLVLLLHPPVTRRVRACMRAHALSVRMRLQSSRVLSRCALRQESIHTTLQIKAARRRRGSAWRRLQALHLLRWRWWAQMLAPPQSLQSLLRRLCSQMLVPPQSLQVLLWRLCWQMPVPPQSLQVLLWRLCWQMLVPPQSLQSLLRRLCWQMLVPPQSLQALLHLLIGPLLLKYRLAGSPLHAALAALAPLLPVPATLPHTSAATSLPTPASSPRAARLREVHAQPQRPLLAPYAGAHEAARRAVRTAGTWAGCCCRARRPGGRGRRTGDSGAGRVRSSGTRGTRGRRGGGRAALPGAGGAERGWLTCTSLARARGQRLTVTGKKNPSKVLVWRRP